MGDEGVETMWRHEDKMRQAEYVLHICVNGARCWMTPEAYRFDDWHDCMKE